jgi:hypothetical protein
MFTLTVTKTACCHIGEMNSSHLEREVAANINGVDRLMALTAGSVT